MSSAADKVSVAARSMPLETRATNVPPAAYKLAREVNACKSALRYGVTLRSKGGGDGSKGLSLRVVSGALEGPTQRPDCLYA